MPTPSKKASIPCHCINTRRAANAITAYYDRMLEPCAVSVSQFSLLWSLDGLGSSNVTQLAGHVGLERSTVVRNIKLLQEKELLEDAPESQSRDRRIRVTPRGKALIEIGIPLWKQAQKDIYSLLGDADTDAFRRVLNALQGL